jgi:hypothetical protein
LSRVFLSRSWTTCSLPIPVSSQVHYEAENFSCVYAWILVFQASESLILVPFLHLEKHFKLDCWSCVNPRFNIFFFCKLTEKWYGLIENINGLLLSN